MSQAFSVHYEGTRDFVATNRDPQRISIILECPQGLAEGADVRVLAITFHMVDFTLSHLVSADVEDGSGQTVVGHGVPKHWTEMTQGGVGPSGGGIVGRTVGEVYLTTVQVRRPLTPGARLVLAFDLTLSKHADISGNLRAQVRQPRDDHFVDVGDRFELSNAAGKPERLEVRVTPVPSADGKTRATVFVTDTELNPVPGYTGKIQLSGDGVTSLAVEASGNQGESVKINDLQLEGDSPVRVRATDAGLGLECVSAPAMTTRLGAAGHYFGSIHYHTNLSVDGDRDPAASYAYARDVLNFDVVAMADHAPPGHYWEEVLAVNEQFNEAGRFVTLPAWESSTSYGHANLYMRTPDVDAGPWFWDPDRNPSEMTWDDDVVVVPHHTNCGQVFAYGDHRRLLSESGVYWGKYDWSVPNERVRLVEIVQGRGSFEADQPDDYWGIKLGKQRASVRDALRMGFRIGFVSGTDNHEGHPGQIQGSYVDLTCFRATELTREAVWQAMNQRRTYATSGAPIIADFAVCGLASGSEGPYSGGGVTFSATLHGTAPIERVEIISNDGTVWQSEPQELDVEIADVALPEPSGAWAYYYLRLRQSDGHIAWLSPVWLDRV